MDVTEAAPLVSAIASRLKPGRALDLASGAGRNALWLAERGWKVTAVDASAEAIDSLRQAAAGRGVTVEARVADLEKGEYAIEPAHWDLVVITYYLQRDLFEPAKRGVAPGGVLIAIVLLGGEGRFRAAPGELRGYFAGWEILHDREGPPADSPHRAVAEIAARKPGVE